MSYRILNRKITVYHALIACGLICGLFYIFLLNKYNAINDYEDDNTNMSSTKLNITRDNKYKFAKPLVYFDIENPSSKLVPIKNKIQKIIQENNESGILTNASVYLRNLETGEWTSINDNLSFHPGSLFKVPMLIYYLKESEKNPSVLDKKLAIGNQNYKIPSQTFNDKSIEVNKPYTVRELLKYMVSYSDNNATFLLNNNCNVEEFKKMFTDFKLPIPDVHDLRYSISVKDYSLFLRTLYNATYLSAENSDYALGLLTESTFNKGITEKIPNQVAVARKFGEMHEQHFKELHECGIIYCSNKPYMLTVMTKGYDSKNLATIISQISDTIFKHFCV